MAYVPFQDEEKQANGSAAPQGGSALPTTGGGSGGATPGGSATPNMAPKSANQGFANINQYLGANEGQGGQVAGTIASNLGNQYNTLQGNVNDAANQATEAIKGSTIGSDQNLIDSATANPSQFVADPNNLAAWQKQYNAAYTGPTAFEQAPGYNKVADAANKASQTYQLGQSGGGYSQLLNQIEKNPTAGRTALDKALIQSDPNAQQTIQGALSPFKGINDYISGKSADISKQASDAAQATADTKAKAQEATQNAVSNFNQDITNKLKSATDARTAGNANLQAINAKVIAGEPLSETEQAQLGINGDQYKKTQDLYKKMKSVYSNTPAQVTAPYFTQGVANNNTPTAENIATPEDFARESALEKLSGNQLGILRNDQIDQAGTYNDTSSAAKYDINKQLADTQKSFLNADANYLLQQNSPQSIGANGLNVNDPAALANYTKWAATQGPAHTGGSSAWDRMSNYQQILDTINRIQGNQY